MLCITTSNPIHVFHKPLSLPVLSLFTFFAVEQLFCIRKKALFLRNVLGNVNHILSTIYNGLSTPPIKCELDAFFFLLELHICSLPVQSFIIFSFNFKIVNLHQGYKSLCSYALKRYLITAISFFQLLQKN